MTGDSPVEADRLGSAAAAIVSQVADEEVRAVGVIPVGVMTHKYQVTSASNENFIVRFYPDSRSFVPEYEPDIVRRCRTHGMRVPEVVADSRSGPAAALTYMVYRMLPGVSLQECLDQMNQRELGSLCVEIVSQLNQLAEIPMLGFGDVLSEKQARSGSWQEFVRDAFEHGLAAARDGNVLEKPLLEAISAIQSNLDRFEGRERGVLAWGDLSPENVIVDQHRRLVGLVDFEGVVAAELDLGLGFMRARYGGTAFCRAMTYNWPENRSGQPRVALYVLVRALRLLRHAREPLPTGLARDPIEVFLPNLRSAATEVSAWLKQP
jgi:aminoglycoside phosphotransferase (APT) family kinase protein